MPQDPQANPQPPRLLSDLELNRGKAELYRPATLLRTTEWGWLTLASLVASFAFPPYFIQVMLLAFFNAGGLLWVTHLSEQGRKRLKDFERQFSQGHEMEEQGRFREAAQFYAELAPRFQEFPKIAEIATRRIEFLKTSQPQAFKPSPDPSLPSARSARSGPSAARKKAKSKKKKP